MEIVYLLAASFARGGIKIAIEQANRLAERGHGVRIIATGPRPDWIEVRVPWHEAGEGPLGSRLPECDLVVFSFYEQAYFVAPAALSAGAVPVYFVQGDEVVFGDPEDAPDEHTRSSILAAQASLQLPYPILTVSRAAASRIRNLGGPAPSVVPNGIDRSVFKPAEKSSRVPRVLSVGAENILFKGIVEICGALIKLHREGVAFRFVRASPHHDMIRELPFPVEFHSAPSQGELAALYAGADLFVGASHSESFYLPPLEAMASGTAVVCSDLPAVQEYAEPGADFLAFPPGDVPALVRQLRRAIRYPKLREKLVERGLRAAEKMDWERIIPRLEAYFKEQLVRGGEVRKALRRELDSPTVPWSIKPEGG